MRLSICARSPVGVQVRKEVIRHARQALDVHGPAHQAAMEYVGRIMRDVAAFPEVAGEVPRASVVTVSFNAIAAAKEDTLRGEVVFTVKYKLLSTTVAKPEKESDHQDDSCAHTCETDKRKHMLTAFVTRVLELFDGSLVRGPGGGWRDAAKKQLYTMSFVCRINGVNKRAAEERRRRRLGAAALDQRNDHRDVVPNNILMPCLTKVRNMHGAFCTLLCWIA